jgi:tetratricopeptide (TPR) repeat protein
VTPFSRIPALARFREAVRPALSPAFASAAAFACLLAFAPPARADAPDPLADAWRDTSASRFKDAHLKFQTLTGPRAELGTALTLLMQQPKTASNVNKAAAILETLADGPADADTTVAALYHLGRIEQVHRQTPDPDRARRYFHKLIAAAPADFHAELAVVKLAIIDLYEDVPAAERRARFDALLPVVATLRSPVCRGDLALLLADAALQFGFGDVLALDLLLEAERAGITLELEKADTLVRIAELARENGRPALARDYYQRFLDENKRDNRRKMVMDRLAALPDPARP